MRSNRIKRLMVSRFLAGTVLGVSLAIAAPAEAQQGQPGRPERSAEGRGRRGERLDPAQRIERRLSRLTEQLKLNSGQTTAIRQIMLEEQAQMKALRPDSAARAQSRSRPDSAAREQIRAQMKALHDRTNTRIEAQLSSEQRSTYRELVQKRGDRQKAGSGRRGAGRDGGGMGRAGQAALRAK